MLSKDEAFFIFNEGKNGMNVNFFKWFLRGPLQGVCRIEVTQWHRNG